MTLVSEDGERQVMKAAGAMTSALECAMETDEKVILLGEDIADPIGGVFKITKGLSTRFGRHRVRATPISEQAIVGTAIGLSMVGYRPVAEIMFFDFITVAMDQIINHAAKSRYMSGGATPAPITVRTTVGGSRFGAQHAQMLEAWFMHTPGIKVVMPSGPRDAKGLLASCIFDDDPCLFIEHMGLNFSVSEEVPLGDFRIPLGQANVLRPGSDMTIVTYGSMVGPCLEAHDTLARADIGCEVIDLRTLYPLDFETIFDSVTKTRRALVVHEATQFCGPGAEISSQIHEQLFGELLAPVLRLGAEYTPVPFSSALSGYPTHDKIVSAVRSAVRP
ncbi:alpha-ketoacid dehydrogenase subunit beta [Mycobacterium sp. AZCC_0083]|uniref:alpha-ketoacid dehydrogenase subunit beta n=1 Tax=Mycobacterium sp. AZCC_0083 TaxID=2735882 RepID=UPI0017A9F000|nr:alpha-ketoacid dehydrogenase subunit beta [Mycobacterium sp. AZCC_0083]MBB5164015.1 pyruvate/2-oxoglutarate/acetoin dehydrogenase E1 component [Mycobacterium sp. AZCC_0083]